MLGMDDGIMFNVVLLFVKPAQPCGSRCARPGEQASCAAREVLNWLSNIIVHLQDPRSTSDIETYRCDQTGV